MLRVHMLNSCLIFFTLSLGTSVLVVHKDDDLEDVTEEVQAGTY